MKANFYIVKLVSADYSVADVESLARLREVIQECIHEYDEESRRQRTALGDPCVESDRSARFVVRVHAH